MFFQICIHPEHRVCVCVCVRLRAVMENVPVLSLQRMLRDDSKYSNRKIISTDVVHRALGQSKNTKNKEKQRVDKGRNIGSRTSNANESCSLLSDGLVLVELLTWQFKVCVHSKLMRNVPPPSCL